MASAAPSSSNEAGAQRIGSNRCDVTPRKRWGDESVAMFRGPKSPENESPALPHIPQRHVSYFFSSFQSKFYTPCLLSINP
ncbi:hypothetical protein MJO28_014600 [Puccinia striiformis f. sp. tritici]|uniref:Uncharacterized protein n=1 Tax=Puccinia striiformis f. sp. tritici TaxID=168172 RepID=A0ACC0DV56_9BASI|nr:hypothetical protein MJO28_014600 [Puccinia striiformis f. sp. tritici]KAI7939732.1 hypothetical protein MJO29_014468 [Puccinia striiformis f. sp. tritici]KAI7939746.1 hypothetical protein MJO29_014482 [Puccinia striiformis f. sp. tritici]